MLHFTLGCTFTDQKPFHEARAERNVSVHNPQEVEAERDGSCKTLVTVTVCINPRQSPQCVLCVLVVYEKFAENPEFRAGNFAVNLKREISHVKLKCHEIPPCS